MKAKINGCGHSCNSNNFGRHCVALAVESKMASLAAQEYSKSLAIGLTHAYTTVEPPNKGHFGDTASVLILEVVLFSEVKMY